VEARPTKTMSRPGDVFVLSREIARVYAHLARHIRKPGQKELRRAWQWALQVRG